MDGQRFDNLARMLSASLNRKGFLAVIAGIAAPAALGDDGAAKKGRKRRNGRAGGVDSQGSNGVCDAFCSGSAPDPRFCGSFGNCGSDDDCIAQDPSRPICCTQSPGCGGAGEGACCSATTVCSGACTKDAECPGSPDCLCDLETNRCQTVLCGGACTKDAECQDYPGCACLEIPGSSGRRACGIQEVCDNFCNKGQCGSGGAEGDRCVCDFSSNTCATIACPGLCEDNADCTEAGDDSCVCFLGVDVVLPVGAEGELPSGSCGACLGAGAECDASTECCGQLVCQSGVCAPKPKPKKRKRCAKAGKSCTQDPGCCAQAICYRGQCGEKDTHCNSDKECARGFSCVGGRLTGGHRRCRRNGRKPPRNRRNRG